jgi:uncharacterized protein (TIGR03435 family)
MRFLIILSLLLASSVRTEGQASFEVASVKPSPESRAGFGGFAGPSRAGRFTVTGTTIKAVIAFAYGIQAEFVQGGPNWIASDRYDIDTKIGEPDTDVLARLAQAKLMLQTLLADRFKLRLYLDAKELSGFQLVIAKNGPKLKQSEGDSQRLLVAPGFGRSSGQLGLVCNAITPTGGSLIGVGRSMSDLAGCLSIALSTPVLDKTAIVGSYDFTVDGYERPGSINSSSPAELTRPSIFEALQDKLGLRLDSAKVPTTLIMIQSVERPTAN